MASSLLEQATESSALMSEVAAAVTSVYPGLSLENVDDVQAFAAKVAADPALTANLESALSKVAAGNGLTFAKEASVAVSAAQLEAASLKFAHHKDNPTQVPIGTPIALLFISAALIFLPTILTTTGTTAL